MGVQLLAISTSLALLSQGPAAAQLAWTPSSPQTNDWKPIIYSDLTTPTASSAVYQELWSNEIAGNNKAYVAKGDFRWTYGNAPAFESHFVVRSPTKTVILSVLDTGSGCSPNSDQTAGGAIVKLCPLLVAVYQGSTVTVVRGRKGCFLENGLADHAGDPTDSVSYAAYDKEHKTIKLGTVVNHRPVSGCSAIIGLE